MAAAPLAPSPPAALEATAWRLRSQLAERVLSARSLDAERRRAEQQQRGAEFAAAVAESAAALSQVETALAARGGGPPADEEPPLPARPASALQVAAPSPFRARDAAAREQWKLQRCDARAAELRRQVAAAGAALARERREAEHAELRRTSELATLRARVLPESSRRYEHQRMQLLRRRAGAVRGQREAIGRRSAAAERDEMQRHDPAEPSRWGSGKKARQAPRGGSAALACADVPCAAPHGERCVAQCLRLMRRALHHCAGREVCPGRHLKATVGSGAVLIAVFHNAAAAVRWFVEAETAMRGHGWSLHVASTSADPTIAGEVPPPLRGPLLRCGVCLGGASVLDGSHPGDLPGKAGAAAMRARVGECVLDPAASASVAALDGGGGRMRQLIFFYELPLRYTGVVPAGRQDRLPAWEQVRCSYLPAPSGWQVTSWRGAARGLSDAKREAQRAAQSMECRLMAGEDESLRLPAPTRVVTLVFTDVQGSTALWDAAPAAMRTALRAHNSMMRAVIQRWHGYEVRTEGDAFMVAFADATHALGWCMEAQKRLMEMDWPREIMMQPTAAPAWDGNVPLFHGLRVRMGFNTCEPHCERDPNTGRMDYFGREVHLAAKVAGQGMGGETVIGSAAFAALQRSGALPSPDVAVTSKGARVLPGLTKEESMFQLLPSHLVKRRQVWEDEEKRRVAQRQALQLLQAQGALGVSTPTSAAAAPPAEEIPVWSRALGTREDLSKRKKKGSRGREAPLTPRRRKQLQDAERCSAAAFRRCRLLRTVLESSERTAMAAVDDSGIEVPPTGRVTLAFTDIAGSTELWEHNTAAMRGTHKQHNALLRRLIGVHSGYEVKTEGDAFMVAFWAPQDALHWCIEAQLALADMELPPELTAHRAAARVFGPEGETLFVGLRVRMGFNTGEPDCIRDPLTGRMDYFGPMVNLAARVAGSGQGGEIVIGSSAYSELLKADSKAGGEVFAGVLVRPKGPLQLKGIQEREPVHSALPRAFGGRWDWWADRQQQDAQQSALASGICAFMGEMAKRDPDRRVAAVVAREEPCKGARQGMELSSMQQDLARRLAALDKRLGDVYRMAPSDFGPMRAVFGGDNPPGTIALCGVHQELGHVVRFCNALAEALCWQSEIPQSPAGSPPVSPGSPRTPRSPRGSPRASLARVQLQEMAEQQLRADEIFDCLKAMHQELLATTSMQRRRSSVGSFAGLNFPRRPSTAGTMLRSPTFAARGSVSGQDGGWRSGLMRMSMQRRSSLGLGLDGSNPVLPLAGLGRQASADNRERQRSSFAAGTGRDRRTSQSPRRRVSLSPASPEATSPAENTLGAASGAAQRETPRTEALPPAQADGAGGHGRESGEGKPGRLPFQGRYSYEAAETLWYDFIELDTDRSRTLTLQEVTVHGNVTIGGHSIGEKLFRKLDKQKLGAATFKDVLALFFERIPEAEMEYWERAEQNQVKAFPPAPPLDSGGATSGTLTGFREPPSTLSVADSPGLLPGGLLPRSTTDVFGPDTGTMKQLPRRNQTQLMLQF